MIVYGPLQLLVNGEPFDATEVAYSENTSVDREDWQFASHYVGECTMEMPAGAWAALVDALSPPRRGASIATLWRRVGYGGRKGRRALSRLRTARW